MTTQQNQEREALPCPFCGSPPKTMARPDNIDGSEFYAAVFCYCDGYSACAHKGARRKTQADASAAAIDAWNNRAALAQQAEPVRVPDGFARVPITLIDEACSSLDDYAAGAPWGSWDRKRRDDLRAILTAAQAAQPEPQRTLVSVSSIDIEKMIARCVPGGTSCDPQQVADDIRRYCNAWPDIEEPQRVGLSEELAAWRERFPQYIYRPQDDMVVLKLDGIKEPT